MIEPAEAIPPTDLTERDHFLTARWGLYTVLPQGLAYAPISHRPWTFSHARLIDLEDELVVAAGLPAPVGEPIVHYSETIRACLGLPHLAPGSR